MSTRTSRDRRRPAATLATVVLAGTAALLATGTASAGALTGTPYRDPNGQVVRWVAANPGSPLTPVIRDRIASQPQAHWMSGFNVGTVASEVASVVNAANAVDQVPVLTAYGIPNRDCGGASAGGATDFPQYQQWISRYAQGLGGRVVVIILETDSLALQDCLGAAELQARNQAISTATRTLKAANPLAKVYLDGGHSAWQTAAVQAARLAAAGVQFADGFFTNVANYRPLSSEAAYGRALIAELASRGAPGKRQIIDTSRNGGATGIQGDWCADDDTDRRIGAYPTLNTGDQNIDGYLWIKRPGEADGCRFTPGTFLPDLAFSQAGSAPNPPAGPGPGTPPGPGAGCTATYRTTNSWQGGFQSEVSVAAGTTPISSWTVTWTQAGGQSITQVWDGILTVSGTTATVRNTPDNGRVTASSTATFGFLASGSASTPTVSCTAG